MINFEEFDFTYGFSGLSDEQKSDCLAALKSAVIDAFDTLNHNDVINLYQADYFSFLDLTHKAKSTLITLCDREMVVLISKIHSLIEGQEVLLSQHLVDLHDCLEDAKNSLEDIELII